MTTINLLGLAGPFSAPHRILEAREDLVFNCPVSRTQVAWAAKDVINPAAVVRDGRVCLLVRAEDDVGRYAGVSRIGLATSVDGLHFELEPEPVLYPDEDRWQAWEWPGGLEGPRIVQDPDGQFVCTYTAFDGKGRLPVRGHFARLADLDQARPGLRRQSLCPPRHQGRRDPNPTQRRPARGGQDRRPLLDVLGRRGDLRCRL